MFRKLKKLYFKIYHLLKLIGVFLVIFGLSNKVYAETDKYYIENGIFKENYTFNNSGGNATYGYIQENYNNENYTLVSCRTWSAWILSFNNNEIETGDIIHVTYKRKAIWVGASSQYTEMKIITLNEEEINNTLFYGQEDNYTEYITKNYTSEQNGTFSIYIANLAASTNYINYGVEIKDIWVTKVNTPEPSNNVYSGFLTIYFDRIVYLAEGFTNNPYLIAMIGIIFGFIVLDLLLKIINIRRKK